MSHRHVELPEGMSHRDVPVRPAAVVVLLASLAVAGIAVVVGLVMLWPSGQPLDRDASSAFAAPGVTSHEAQVLEVGPACESVDSSSGSDCGQLRATLLDGPDAATEVTLQVTPVVSESGLQRDDTIELLRLPAPAGQSPQYSFFGVDRGTPLGVLAAVFVVAVALVARLRGVLALLGLGVGAFVVVRFMLPALLEGGNGMLVGIVGSAAIMYVVLYLAHGPSVRTSAALAGTLVGVGITAAVGLLAIDANRLSGISDESGAALAGFATELDFRGLLICAVIVAGLGVLNDVTITQASAVWELRGAGPELTRLELYSRAMRIGRDHIASTIYTIVFAYSGAALSTLLLLYFYDRPLLDVLSTEEIAVEVMRTLSSGIGLVLAVPLTTAIAAMTVRGAHAHAQEPAATDLA